MDKCSGDFCWLSCKCFIFLIGFLQASFGVASVAANSLNVRVEFELKRLSNVEGILQTGGKCSLLGKSCNQKVSGYVDTSGTSKGWPGSQPVASWPDIISAKNNNVVIDKVISGDFCTGSYKDSTLRVHVVDTGLKDKLIEDFECSSGDSVAPSLLKAEWSQELECHAKYNPQNNRLSYRVKAYALPSDSCGHPSGRPSH